MENFSTVLWIVVIAAAMIFNVVSQSRKQAKKQARQAGDRHAGSVAWPSWDPAAGPQPDSREDTPVRQEVQQEVEKILAADVGKALDQQTLAKLIQAALQGEDVSGYAVEVGQVTDGIRQQLAQELKNGLELRPSKKVGAGFRLAAKDGSGYFDCSDQEIAEMLMPFFRDMHL